MRQRTPPRRNPSGRTGQVQSLAFGTRGAEGRGHVPRLPCCWELARWQAARRSRCAVRRPQWTFLAEASVSSARVLPAGEDSCGCRLQTQHTTVSWVDFVRALQLAVAKELRSRATMPQQIKPK